MTTSEKSNVVYIADKGRLALSKSFLIARGTPILPRSYEQQVDTPEDLYDLSKESEAIFLHEMDEISRALRMKTLYPGLKSIARIAQKADEEKTGRVQEVFDSLRIAFIADRPSQIKKAMDFFAPNKNSRVVDMVNQFAVPDPESRIRRSKIIYEAQAPIFTEVQIWSSAMLNAFEESHVSYEHQRKLKADLKNGASCLPYKTYAQLEAKERILGRTRCAIHDDAAEKAGLNRFLENRTFGQIGDIPIVAIELPLEANSYPTILRPDVKSGVYVADNSLYADFVKGNYRRTSRDDFLKASHSLAIDHIAAMRNIGQQLPAALAHCQIA